MRAKRPSSNVRQQIGFYEETAAKYDSSPWSLGNRDNRNHLVKVRSIAQAIGASTANRVLEVGTGTGLHARWLMQNTGIRYTGLDASEAMLSIARDRLSHFTGRFSLEVADAHQLPFADGTFDAAFCAGTLHHLNAPQRGVAEMVRATRPGGLVAFMEPNWKYPSVMVYSAITPAEHNTFKISPRRLVEWARRAGLEDVETRRLLYTPPAPRSWNNFWDAVDRGVGRLPGLRRLSIVMLVSGRVPG